MIGDRLRGEPARPIRAASDEVGIRELKARASELVDRVVAGDRLVVTRRNRPVAVLLGIDDALDFVLAHAGEFEQARIAARTEHETGCWAELDPSSGDRRP